MFRHFLCFVCQSDVALVHEIEAVIGEKLAAFECKENEVLEEITKVRRLQYTICSIFSKFTVFFLKSISCIMVLIV